MWSPEVFHGGAGFFLLGSFSIGQDQTWGPLTKVWTFNTVPVVTLPDARQLRVGFGVFWIFIEGGGATAVKDKAGNTIATLTPATATAHGIFSLTDNSTQAGTWVVRTS